MTLINHCSSGPHDERQYVPQRYGSIVDYNTKSNARAFCLCQFTAPKPVGYLPPKQWLAEGRDCAFTRALTPGSEAATMPIMPGARRAAALLSLVSLIAPGASSAVVTFHLSAHHAGEAHEEHHNDAADLSVLWHGHGHEATTPDHDHPLLVAGMQAFRIPAVDQAVQSPPGPWHPAAVAPAAAPRVSRLSPPGPAGVGPPPHAHRLSILRI